MNKLRIGSIISLAGLAVLLLGPLTAQARIDNQPSITSSTVASAIPDPLHINSVTVSSTITSNQQTTSSVIGYFNKIFTMPPPADLIAGTAICGITTNVSRADDCVADIYSYGRTLASTTAIFVPYLYNTSGTINFGVQDAMVFMYGIPGRASGFNLTAASGSVITFNNCNSNNKTRVLQAQSLYLSSNSATSTNGGTTAMLFGGTNGGCATQVDNINVRTVNLAVNTATTTYLLFVTNSHFANIQRCVEVNAPSNSGETIEFKDTDCVDPAGTASGGTGSPLNMVNIESTGSSGFTWGGGSIDNAQVVCANGDACNIHDVFFENPGGAQGVFDFIVVSSSPNGTLANIHDNFFTQDATSSAGGPIPEFLVCGANCNIHDNYFVKNTNATTTTNLVAQLAGSGNNAKITLSNNLNVSGTAYSRLYANTALATNNGSMYTNGNSYLSGFDYGIGNNTISFYNGGGVTAMNTIVGGGNFGNGSFWNFGGTATPSSTVSIQGASARQVLTLSVSSTLLTAGSGANLASVYLLNSSVVGSTTMPLGTSTQNRDMIFKVVGSAAWGLVATSTDCFRAVAGTATSSYMPLAIGSSTELVNSGNLCGGASSGVIFEQLWAK